MLTRNNTNKVHIYLGGWIDIWFQYRGCYIHNKTISMVEDLLKNLMNDKYDYIGYYMKYPNKAEAMLKGDKKAHFTDEFKLPNHATFSDESIYSKQRGGGT